MQEWIEDTLPPMILAVMGGIADYLMSDDHSIWNMFIGMFLAGFTGYIVILGCSEMGASDGVTGITCGIAGLSSRVLLQIFKTSFIEKFRWYVRITDAKILNDKPKKKKKKKKKECEECEECEDDIEDEYEDDSEDDSEDDKSSKKRTKK